MIGLMALVALLAIDFAAIPAFRNPPYLSIRIGFFGALPMANVLAVYLAHVWGTQVLLAIAARGNSAIFSGFFLRPPARFSGMA
jgi:hypothetical protein